MPKSANINSEKPQSSMADFRIDRIPPYVLGDISQRIIKARQDGVDLIDLSQFNPDLPAPARAVDRLVQGALRPGNHRYSSSQGISKLREAICKWYQKRFDVDLDFDKEAIVTLGTKEGLSHLCQAILFPGESVLVPMPSYPIHTAAVFIAGAAFIGVPLSESGGNVVLSENSDFFQQLELIYRNTWPRARLMVVNFPHNPTTTTVDISFWERLVHFAKSNEVILVNDFAYGDLVFDERTAPSLLSVEGAKEIAVEFYSMSKSFSLPGWRLGFCVGNQRIISALKRIKSYLDYGVFQPLQLGVCEALNSGESIIKENKEIYQSRRDVLVEGLCNIGWKVQSPCATAFLWAKIPDRFDSLGSIEFSRLLFEKSHVAVSPGIGFDMRTDDHVRFALCEGEPRLRKAVERIKFLFEEQA